MQRTLHQKFFHFAQEMIYMYMSKLVGLGFDGCSTMAGTEGGVQKLI